jgi:hypothetical protein
MRAISQIPVNFAFQSYFDDTLLQKAILEQAPGEGIVPSTLKRSQDKGNVVGLGGTSDCPLAIRFRGGRDSAPIILRPGQVIRPGRFDGFDYGLPFGWLGGGLAVLFVGHEEDVDSYIGAARPEIIFHRTRLKIVADAVTPTLVKNWPLRFPWTQAVRGASSSNQNGAPLLTVEPTRTLLRLRMNDIVGHTVRLIFRGSHDFDQDSAGAVGTTDQEYVDLTFPANGAPTSTPYPMVELPAAFARLACDEGGVSATNLGVAALTDQYIDVVRYGRI